MKKPEPKYQPLHVPRLDPDIKEMNGRSTRRLEKCIEALTALLEENEPRCCKPEPDEDSDDCVCE